MDNQDASQLGNKALITEEDALQWQGEDTRSQPDYEQGDQGTPGEQGKENDTAVIIGEVSASGFSERREDPANNSSSADE